MALVSMEMAGSPGDALCDASSESHPCCASLTAAPHLCLKQQQQYSMPAAVWGELSFKRALVFVFHFLPITASSLNVTCK